MANGHGGSRRGAGRPRGSRGLRNKYSQNLRFHPNYVEEDIFDEYISFMTKDLMKYLNIYPHQLKQYLRDGLPHYMTIRQGENPDYDTGGIRQRGFIKAEVDEWCLANARLLVAPPARWKIANIYGTRDKGKALLIYPEGAF